MQFLTDELDSSESGHVGYFDEASQYQYVHARADRTVRSDLDVLELGRAGADGILFVMKREDPAVYAYYPIEDCLEPLAGSFSEFIRRWRSGRISV